MITFILGFILGATFGLITSGLLVSSRKNDTPITGEPKRESED